MKHLLLTFLGVLINYLLSCDAKTIYVDISSTASSATGNSWTNAYRSVQAALNAASNGDEIWVAQGTYTPTRDNDRETSFTLVHGVSLYGGFQGTETSRTQRDPSIYLSILSGNIGDSNSASDNSYHVLVAINGIEMTLDGFTISDGNANGDLSNGFGAGLLNSNSTKLKINNCIFKDNVAYQGGAIYNFYNVLPKITNTYFVNNKALSNEMSGGLGGAVLNRNGANATYENCYFIGNYAVWRGGAVYTDYGANPIFSSCEFTENWSDGHGGASYTDDRASQIGVTAPSFSNCVFDSNQAVSRGGAAANYDFSTPTFTSCVFTNNSADIGGAIANWDSVTTTNMHLGTCTFSGNTAVNGNSDVDTDTNYYAEDYLSGDYLSILKSLWETRDSEDPVSPFGVIYVKSSSTSRVQDGSSWSAAYTSLQSAIDDASTSRKEIWVATGTYYPDVSTSRGMIDPNSSFLLKPGVILYGGFSGSETSRSSRNWFSNPTILSGDLDKDGTFLANAWHVVVGANQAKLDGFVISDGYALEVTSLSTTLTEDQHTDMEMICTSTNTFNGGGLINFQTAMLIQNTVFYNNWAYKGGAVYNMNFDCNTLTPSIASQFNNVGFVKNYAEYRGAAVSNDAFTNTTFTSCIFYGNAVDGKGGGIYNDFVSCPIVTDCNFTNNFAQQGGAGIGNDGSSWSTITSTVFVSNTCMDAGCALYQGTYNAELTHAGATVVDSTITGSFAPFGQKSIFNWAEDTVIFTNTVISE